MPVAAPASRDLDRTVESRPGSQWRPTNSGVAVAVGGVVFVGVVLRFATTSPLWLDEALSVNIAQQPLGEIAAALRHDGHPPLYYWLLYGWIKVFGDSDIAVRALSGVASVVTLPLAYAAGKRLGGPSAGVATLVMLALLPFAARYATETRMYALVMLAVTAGYLAVRRTLERPTLANGAAVAVAAAALCWLQYWGVFLAAATALVLLFSVRRRFVERRAGLTVVAGIAAGAATLVFWLPSLLYQMRHTGTPWAATTRPTSALAITIDDFGGLLVDGHLLGVLLSLFIAMALFLTPSPDHPEDVRFNSRTVPGVRGEVAVVALTLGLGVGVAVASQGGYESRYAAVVAPLIVLAAAVGVSRLPRLSERAVVLGVAAVLCAPGLADSVAKGRTQGGEVVSALNEFATPGDVVVYCPDQLGPAFSRGLEANLDLSVYPTGEPPVLVDWADYEARNAAADPAAFADTALAAAGGRDLWYVWSPGYRTFGTHCEELSGALQAARPDSSAIIIDDGEEFFEHAWLIRHAPPP